MNIKFRAKTLISREWVYGYQINSVTIRTHHEEEMSELNHQYDDHLIDPDTLSIHLGVIDKNGTEIYQGDFCKQYFKPIASRDYDRYYHIYEMYFSNKGVGTRQVAGGRYQIDLPEELKGNIFADNTYHELPRKNEPIIYSTIGVGGAKWEVIGNVIDSPNCYKEGAFAEKSMT